MGYIASFFSYLPFLLALYSAWNSGGYTPLLQFGLTIIAGRLLNSGLSFLLNLALRGATTSVLAQVSLIPIAISTGAYFCGCSMQMLASYFFTSFVFPGVRKVYPSMGTPFVSAAIVAGVAYAWASSGISPFFVFVIFLQALPELQRPLWIGGPTKTKLHASLVIVVCLLFAPFALLGGVAVAKPEMLTNLTEGQLRSLCQVSNGCPSIDHRDLYAALGLSKYATPAEVRKAYRQISLENHPDKLVELELTEEERADRVDAFTHAASAYEILSKPGAQGQYDAMVRAESGIRPELLDLAPRCVACAMMLIYWLAMTFLQAHQASKEREAHRERFRRHIIMKGPLNLPAIGLKSREPIEHYAKFYEVPMIIKNDEEELMTLRRLLTEAGIELADPDPKAAKTVIRSTRGDPEGLRAHVLNGGAIMMEAVGIAREDLDEYAADPNNPMVAVTDNGKDDVLMMRGLLEQGGYLLTDMPEGPVRLVDVPP